MRSTWAARACRELVTPRRDVLIAVPACNEESRLPGCLDAIQAAVEAARRSNLIDHVVLAVAAHRSHDTTAEIASSALAGTTSHRHHSSGVVWIYDHPATVGHVRTQLVLEAMHSTGIASRRTWLFSTDADTLVPPHWILTGLDRAAATGADLVTGMVDLDRQETPSIVIDRHDDFVRAGTRPDGTHDHVYAANLMIKMDVFLRLDGFPSVEHGEEHALVAAARAAGSRCVSDSSWRVTTSGRTVGRATHGLAAVLDDLQRSAREVMTDGGPASTREVGCTFEAHGR